VDRLYTDLAVIDITKDGLLVRELVEGLSFEQLQRITPVPLKLAPIAAAA
jgi:3-oxoadipate CoA-transferase beta subunit